MSLEPGTPLRADDLPLRYNAVDVLERNLEARAGKTALFSPERDLSFAELAREVDRLGNALRRLGVRRGDVVGLLMPDCVEWVAGYFATLKLGGVALSLNTLLTPEEHAHALTDSYARVLLAHRGLLPALEPLRSSLPFLEQVVAVGAGEAGGLDYAALLAAETDGLDPASVHREDVATLNYSSGTTGRPKGVPHAHKDLALSAQLVGANVLGLTESDRTFAASKLFFTFGTGGNLVFPFWVGASAVLFPGSPRVAANLLGTIERFRPTVHYNAPTGYAAMLAAPGFPRSPDLSSLRLCVSAGEALPAPIWHAWKDRTGLEIVDGIGSTENWHMFVCNRPGEVRAGSSGRPVPGYEVKLTDDEGRPVPAGEVGNLFVRGETAALAYLHREADSRRTFQGEWMRTGDKYSRDADGYYWHAGRSDDMLKVGGQWVSPVEVESAVLGHPAVLECAVVGLPDAAGLVKPRAYVVLKPGYAAGDELAADIVGHCRRAMADFKRPRTIEFVVELPKTATGKIQRYRLREQAG